MRVTGLRFPPSLAIALGALAVLAAAGAARAQSLAIEPVTVQLAPGQMAATLTVVNQSPDESDFQVRAYGWAVEKGEDKLTPTGQVVLSPPLGRIAPQARQLIRLVLRTPPKDHEETYRIWLDQIPPPSEPGSVRIALRLSIPVFALPAVRTAPDLQWQLVPGGGKLVLTARNRGTRHQTVRNLTVTAADGTVLKPESSVSPYILAGAARSWTLVAPDGKPAAAGAVHLTATTDDGALDQTVAP